MADGVNNDLRRAGPIEDRVRMRVQVDAAKAGAIGRSADTGLRRNQRKHFIEPVEYVAGA